MNGAVAMEARGVRRAFRSGFVLDVPEFRLAAGRVTALLGPSGSGKSTLLAVLGLLEQPDEGVVVFGDRVVSAGDKDAREGIAAVFQRPWLFKGSVGANVEYGLRLRGVAPRMRTAAAEKALERVGLEGTESRSAHALSGGEAQRVALARALVLQPRVLLLDEPLASLDAALKTRLAGDFARILGEGGVTTLYVTHDHDEAMMMADEVALMRDGTIVTHGTVDAVMGLPEDEWTAAFLGMEAPIRGVVRDASEGLVRVDVGGADLYAVGDWPPHTPLALGVRPEDILIFEAEAELPLSSARNRVLCRVVEVHPRGATMRLTLEAGWARMAATVSRAAVEELRIAQGVEVLAVFKATAVRARAVGAEASTGVA